MQKARERKPDWLKISLNTGDGYKEINTMMRGRKLHTVCEEAKCPNIYECWSQRTATFMILGNICTRACRFCAVTSGLPTELDLEEPRHVAQSVKEMGLKHVVITSVARDDLNDHGASMFAATITAVRESNPLTDIEVLIPDLGGEANRLALVLAAKPDVLNHNLETVSRLSDKVRAKAKYQRSLSVLRLAKELRPEQTTKSGMMVGLGETKEEIIEAMKDLRAAGCDILTIGQYLQPTFKHIGVDRYYEPSEFAELKREGLALGFAHVEAGPLVRSSYHAREQTESAKSAAAGTEAAVLEN
ncbi:MULTISPECIES: lipoyl synthase [unclassified Paenibacillus]|uniref:lipoyl synthase n=1 Tax=unclassified Paenibacillus TaxID=185978 RepID=UPI002404E867|nr:MULTISPECIES: lipoyl synthase [unclassified Paenibacillus]MDF9843070.1 lipoic acid synthetase [Paenibacillus sp. PastF-2]MDF9849718.1 lipoic acid synthetase [Paenibacillus sp. PastM-2]MDF9856365.1 lipoic acid synthetase [Paenibacillus sp. PastF-1]MDH6481636.1 lipoic acid synthetase [Paenibacillus sp. PastH-2]MDH6508918.1 lipoic acid synthetase [Paenibacillus sp. PastM-3]